MSNETKYREANSLRSRDPASLARLDTSIILRIMTFQPRERPLLHDTVFILYRISFISGWPSVYTRTHHSNVLHVFFAFSDDNALKVAYPILCKRKSGINSVRHLTIFPFNWAAAQTAQWMQMQTVISEKIVMHREAFPCKQNPNLI